jgi:predicted nucleic acid-binding protein
MRALPTPSVKILLTSTHDHDLWGTAHSPAILALFLVAKDAILNMRFPIMRIYLDNCCYNRPFDDLSQDRVYLEAEAVVAIISYCERGDWALITSGVVEYEALLISSPDRLENIRRLFAVAVERADLTDETVNRAAYFKQNGLHDFDSLHLAAAETNHADVFLTTDDRLLRAARKLDIKIKVANPVTWLMEVLNNE